MEQTKERAREQEIREEIARLRLELSEICPRSFSYSVNDFCYHLTCRGEIAKRNTCEATQGVFKLALRLCERVGSDSALKQKDLTPQERKVALEFMNEVIPIYNKKFLELHKDLQIQKR